MAKQAQPKAPHELTRPSNGGTEASPPEKPVEQITYYMIPAPVMAVTLEILGQLPHKQVRGIIPALEGARTVEAPAE